MPEQNYIPPPLGPPPPPSRMPSASTTIGTLGGLGLSPVVVWAIQSILHVDVPPEVAASLGAFLGQVVGYFFDGGRKQ